MNDRVLIFSIIGGVIATVVGAWIVSSFSIGTPGAAQAASGGVGYPARRVSGGGYVPAFTSQKQPQRDIYSTQPKQLQRCCR